MDVLGLKMHDKLLYKLINEPENKFKTLLYIWLVMIYKINIIHVSYE